MGVTGDKHKFIFITSESLTAFTQDIRTIARGTGDRKVRPSATNIASGIAPK